MPKDGVGEGIPVTYVPARNTVFLSLALAWAEAAGARDLFVGVNALDYSGYPDCRPEFIAAFEALANKATKAGVEGDGFTIHAPLQHMTKADIAREAARLGLDAGISHSCYDPAPDGGACGLCDACRLRAKGFEEAGLADPTRYATPYELRGQGSLPDAAGRGRAGRQPRGIPALCRLQPMERARAGSGDGAMQFLRYGFRRDRRTGRRQVRDRPRRLQTMSKRCGARDVSGGWS